MNNQRDERYAIWWLPIFYFTLTLIGPGFIGGTLQGELRDAQRRIAVLEQQCE